jgi:DNA recombination protein RmuC
MVDPISVLIGLALGLLIGGLVAWLIGLQVRQPLHQQLSRLESQLAARQEQIEAQAQELQGYRVQHIEHQEQVLDLTRDLSRMQESYTQLNRQMDQRSHDLDQLQARFQQEFEHLAGRVLADSARQLSADQQSRLGTLLQPLQERLQAFEQRVEHSYGQEARERFSLQREIERLASLNQQMSEDAQNLTRALKGDNKTQGNWGELVLARVLESSGLREGEEFVVQSKALDLRDPDGRRLQPDVIIQLPEGKHLIIDAKVSLTAYQRYLSADEESQRLAALKQHLTSVSTHIRQLSDKHYSNLQGVQSPDFVLMFMPVEPAFSLAIQADGDLFSFAWDRRIVLVSPTTLLATLKTVASLWRLEQQNRNAEEIARQGGALYDKFVGFVEDLQKIGGSLDRAQRQYHDAMGKLHSGHGSLSARAEKLRQLGISHSKHLD